jgi:hypothetical protein
MDKMLSVQLVILLEDINFLEELVVIQIMRLILPTMFANLVETYSLDVPPVM